MISLDVTADFFSMLIFTAYLVHAIDDNGVKVENSLYYEAALRQHHVVCDMFLYAKGGHAFSIENRTCNVQWVEDCIEWIKKDGWKK